ncbi:hypothetical protein JKY72_07200 [Candidatus Gracilibacteria bacterium]|nr:hypothetical protein [Candidatus Gracilibacteria bacterium]
MSAALVTIAHGEPEWWTGPDNTGVQLLAGNAFAAEFVAEQTTADLVEIRRIVFQMLGMDHLVLFIDACSNCLQPRVDDPENCIILPMVYVAYVVVNAESVKANIHRLLWFALECGLDLRPTARHITPIEFAEQGTNPCGMSLQGHESCDKLNTTDMLVKLRLQHQHIDDDISHAVLACTTVVTSPIFDDDNKVMLHDTVRLCTSDSGSSAWHEILDLLFIYHKRVSPAASSLSIMSKCLHEVTGKTIVNQLVQADWADKHRRILPYLLRKPDLSSCFMFNFSRGSDSLYLNECAKLCVDRPDWPQACAKLINLIANHTKLLPKFLITRVNNLPSMNVTSQADIAAYIIANVKLDSVRELSGHLMQVVVRYGTFNTPFSIDCVLAWMNNKYQFAISKVACMFAHQLFLTRPVAERAAIYERLLKVNHRSPEHGEIIYYLMHGEDAFGTYKAKHLCSLHLVFDMLDNECNDSAIAYIIDASLAREQIQMPSDCIANWILGLYQQELRFDLLMRLVNRHYRPGIPDRATTLLLVMKLGTTTCYSVEQRHILINRILQSSPM